MTNTFKFALTSAAFALTAGTASATLVCPDGSTYPHYGQENAPEICAPVVSTPTVEAPTTTNNGGTSFSKSKSSSKAKASATASATATANQRQKQQQRQSQTAKGGSASVVTGDDVLSQALRNAVSIDNSVRQSAQTVIAPPLPGYGPANCFGDTNPSGQFTAAFGNALFQAAAARSKPSNICAVAAVAGERGVVGYLAEIDPAFRNVALANGWVVTR